MNTISVSAGKANRPSFIPPEPAIIQCNNCGFVTRKGSFVAQNRDPGCPNCKEAFPRPDLASWGESDEWHDQNRRDRRAFERWSHWQHRASLRIVPAPHPRYAAWMALRCYLLDQPFLRRADGDLVAHLAAVAVMGMSLKGGEYYFNEIYLHDDFYGDFLRSEEDGQDIGLGSAVAALQSLLIDPVGSNDGILQSDHTTIQAANWEAMQ